MAENMITLMPKLDDNDIYKIIQCMEYYQTGKICVWVEIIERVDTSRIQIMFYDRKAVKAALIAFASNVMPKWTPVERSLAAKLGVVVPYEPTPGQRSQGAASPSVGSNE